MDTGTSFDKIISVSKDIYWCGVLDLDSNFQCNPYLVLDEDRALLIDPGAAQHFPVVMRKVLEIIDPQQIEAICLTHQDPDLCGCLPIIEEIINNPNLQIIAEPSAKPFISYYGIKQKVTGIQEIQYELKLNKKHFIFIPTPYLHAPGAMVIYEKNSKVLFTSDLFGGYYNNDSVLGYVHGFEGFENFHKIYVPHQEILNSTLDYLEKLDIKMIAPQHGAVLSGEDIKKAFSILRNIKSGVLMDSAKTIWKDLFNKHLKPNGKD